MGCRRSFPTNSGKDRRRVADVVAELEATTVVVGLPLSLAGRAGVAAQAAAEEARLLAEEIGDDAVTVETFDERLTTVTAQARGAGRRGNPGTGGSSEGRRAAAAAVLLQAWLDAQ